MTSSMVLPRWTLGPFARREPAGRLAAGSLSLGILVVIVVGGTILLGAALAFLCLWLSRRRRRTRRHGDFADDNHTDEDSAAGDDGTEDTRSTTTRRGRRLRKRPSNGGGGKAGPPRRASFIQRSSLPVLPPLFTRRRSSFNPFNAPPPGEPSPARSRASATWLDDDALHGPTVRKPAESRRFSVRESWPLRAMAPTIPRLHQLPAPSPRGGYGDKGAELLASAPRSMLRPPRPVLVIPPGISAVVPSGALYGYQSVEREAADASSPMWRSGPGRSPAAGMRTASTDSTLSMILRSTERRLQEAGTTAVARRNRMSVSPTKGSTFGGGQHMGGSQSATASTPSHSARQTPSPTKASHGRQLSQSSVLSEADSLLGEPSPTSDVRTALTSPNRALARTRDAARPSSCASSVSSALPTVYSEDENHEGTTQATSAHSFSSLPDTACGVASPVRTAAAADPFAESNTEDRPRVDWHLGHGDRELNRPPRLRQTTLGQLFSPDRGDAAARPLSQISGNEQARDGAPAPGGGGRESPDKADASPAQRRAAHRESWVRAKPALIVTSPSAASVGTTPPYGCSGQVVQWSPPALEGRESVDGDSTPSLPGSPEMRLIPPHAPEDWSEPPSPTAAAGNMCWQSTAASADAERYQVPEDTGALRKVGASKTTVWGQDLLPPPPSQGRGGNVSTTVAELRRMNSEVSAYSAAAEVASNICHGNTGCKAGPGGAAKGRGGGSKAYLSLGGSGTTAGGSPTRVGRAYHGGGQTSRAGKADRNEDPDAILEESTSPRVRGDAARRTVSRSPPKRASVILMESPQKGMGTPGRQSEDSLGLYDGDGFLICSPMKG